jgi:flagellar basal-body rod protein FlgB
LLEIGIIYLGFFHFFLGGFGMIVSRASKKNEAMLDMLNQKNKIIANNIANADTPGFKAKSVAFQEEFLHQIAKGSAQSIHLNRTNSKHLPMKSDFSALPYKIVEMNDTAMNNNQNNVDIDAEMAELASNQLAYNLLVDRVSGHYSKYKNLLNDLK